MGWLKASEKLPNNYSAVQWRAYGIKVSKVQFDSSVSPLLAVCAVGYDHPVWFYPEDWGSIEWWDESTTTPEITVEWIRDQIEGVALGIDSIEEAADVIYSAIKANDRP